MIKPYEIFATWFYSGYLKPASGTWGTLASLPLCFAIAIYCGVWGLIIGSLILFCIGLWAANRYEIETGEHDSSRIVIDEAAGMMLAALPIVYFPQYWWIVGLCFITFRIFDAVKIGPVGWLDKNIHGAWGVMIDDIAAGFLAAIVIFGGFLLWTI